MEVLGQIFSDFSDQCIFFGYVTVTSLVLGTNAHSWWWFYKWVRYFTFALNWRGFSKCTFLLNLSITSQSFPIPPSLSPLLLPFSPDLNFFWTRISLSPWPISYLTLNRYQMMQQFCSELFWIHCNRGHGCLPLRLPWIIDYFEKKLLFFIIKYKPLLTDSRK